MLELTLEQIQSTELAVLVSIDEICKKLQIQYSLAGGTMLGAVRHNGFIPWDDDIDIVMFRSEYEKFLEYCREHTELPFHVLCYEHNREYCKGFAKAMDKSTVIRSRFDEIASQYGGVCVDIFPIDYLGDTYESAISSLNKTRFLRELTVARYWNKFQRSVTRSIIYEPIRFSFFLLSRFFDGHKLLKRIDCRYRSERKEYSGCIYGSYRNKEVMATSVFENIVPHVFENKLFPISADYDTYLTNLYGDYMKLPPINKRVTRHDYKVYYKDA